MDNQFYNAFEKKFRGSSTDIKGRLMQYSGILNHIQSSFNNPTVLDIGSGRGEWLEICNDFNFETTGIEINKSFISILKEKGLNVVNSDALDHLKTLPNCSINFITCFHVIEHLSDAYLFELIKEMRRVIYLNGFIIIETPSIDNPLVSSKLFYQDFTHINHINPDSFAFLMEYAGFKYIEYYNINGGPLQDGEQSKLTRVFNGIAQDVCFIASPSILEKNISKNLSKELYVAPNFLAAVCDYDYAKIDFLKKNKEEYNHISQRIDKLEKTLSKIYKVYNMIPLKSSFIIFLRILVSILRSIKYILGRCYVFFKKLLSKSILETMYFIFNISPLLKNLILQLIADFGFKSISSKIESKYLQINLTSKKSNKFNHFLDTNFYTSQSAQRLYEKITKKGKGKL